MIGDYIKDGLISNSGKGSYDYFINLFLSFAKVLDGNETEK